MMVAIILLVMINPIPGLYASLGALALWVLQSPTAGAISLIVVIVLLMVSGLT